MTGDPSWPVGRLGILDASVADVSLLTTDHIRDVAAAFGAHRSKLAGIKYAIVAGEAAHAYALAFQQAIGPMGLVTVVFSHFDLACAWLGITVEDVEPTVEELRLAIRTAEQP